MKLIATKRIDWKVSLILDTIRLCAALIVFFVHGYSMWFNKSTFYNLDLGHFCVVIFFVLSGYLISYTTFTNNRGISNYAQARLSRLYSVLFPAIIITVICHVVVYFTDAQLSQSYNRSPVVLRYLLATFCSTELWFTSVAPPINGPLWSLCYEFWYYIIFGLWFYFKRSWKIVFCIASVFLAGPAIIAMMPIWIMGCLAFKLSKPQISTWQSWVLFISFMFIAIILSQQFLALPYKLGYKPLYYANQFITDLVSGVFVALSLWIITGINVAITQKPKSVNTFRKIADLTFSLYVLHFPLLILLKSFFKINIPLSSQFSISMVLVVFLVYIIGNILERKRRWWNDNIGIVLLELKLRFYK